MNGFQLIYFPQLLCLNNFSFLEWNVEVLRQRFSKVQTELGIINFKAFNVDSLLAMNINHVMYKAYNKSQGDWYCNTLKYLSGMILLLLQCNVIYFSHAKEANNIQSFLWGTKNSLKGHVDCYVIIT